jgi:branched-chain amino acid aminotransferase, group II
MDVQQSSRFTVTQSSKAVPADQRAVLLADPGFGKLFTDHMVTIRYTEGQGWHSHAIGPREPFQLDPACAVLHYAQEIFEGMKAYRLEDGSIAMFRPEENARRFNESAERMAMPVLPEEVFLEAVEALVKIDADWIPAGEGSLYLRPFLFASETFLGVRPANEYIFCVIASPAGAYFKGGKKAVTLWVSEHFTRAARGGTGAAKCGGNYAASLVAQKEAIKHGCDQVVFLDAAENKWVEELGGMNVFFVMDDGSIVTPPLGGTILPGITRNSIISLARAKGHEVREEPYSFAQWRADAASGKLREAFACGTAAVVTAIGTVKSVDGDFTVGNGDGGIVTEGLRADLTGIQRGTVADPANWVRTL